MITHVREQTGASKEIMMDYSSRLSLQPNALITYTLQSPFSWLLATLKVALKTSMDFTLSQSFYAGLNVFLFFFTGSVSVVQYGNMRFFFLSKPQDTYKKVKKKGSCYTITVYKVRLVFCEE